MRAILPVLDESRNEPYYMQLYGYLKSLSAIRVVSSAYLRLLIFLPAILILACASSSPAFLMMCSACKLDKQGTNVVRGDLKVHKYITMQYILR